ncbi:uncharacterized protein [Miscanthus floridulus]|uniref:uncharacterized protein n=1 Tax=Miscanthus floridulus TaxID=154761 RepID=UPI003458AC76
MPLLFRAQQFWDSDKKATAHNPKADRVEAIREWTGLGSPPAVGETEATIDIKLPRRSLLVQFICNACGERTKRLINRVAYERGTIFLKCAGCQVYHKFVDNLGLVVEYDLREESELQGENVVNPNSED